MATTKLMTSEDLWEIDDDFNQYELMRGELHKVPPAGGDHGVVNGEFGRRIANHVHEHRLGRYYQGETGFILARDPDTNLAPDIAFVHRDRIIRGPDHRGFLEQAPDLVVEIISPSQSRGRARTKMEIYMEFGVRMGLLVDPYRQTITIYRPGRDPVVLGRDDIFDGDDVLPGFRLNVSDLFIA